MYGQKKFIWILLWTSMSPNAKITHKIFFAKTTMPFPRISGVLNNCPLHVLTPELRAEITLLAEGGPQLFGDFILGYDLFKTKFAEFYQSNPSSFSWENFAACIKDHNDFDLQMILGPVLRSVLAENMRKDHGNTLLYQAADEHYSDADIDDFINYKTQIQENGRYASLSPDEMFTFVAGPLGLAVKYHQEGQDRKFPEDEQQEALFVGRPCIAMFHQGGVEGAGAGGHFERTLGKEGRIDYEQASDVHLRIVAELFKQDSPALTKIGLYLLPLYMEIIVCKLRNRGADVSEMLETFHLTVAQIEKFLYNRLYVSGLIAKALLGELTSEAATLIAEIPELETMEYDAGIQFLIGHYFAYDSALPVKSSPLSTQQYEIALTLLTPPVPQNQAHSYRRSPELAPGVLWELRANEISALQSLANGYAEHIIFDQGLSGRLYALCNRPEIARELLPDFLELLASDHRFQEKASEILKSHVLISGLVDTRAVGRSVSRSVSAIGVRSHTFSPGNTPPLISKLDSLSQYTPYTDPDLHEVYNGGCSGSGGSYVYFKNCLQQRAGNEETPSTVRTLFDSKSDEEDKVLKLKSGFKVNSGTVAPNCGLPLRSTQPAPSDLNTCFWLRAIQGCLAIGGVCAVIAVLSCPPVAAALGLATVFGVAVSDIAVTATFLAGTSVLLAASMFAVKQTMDDPVVEKPFHRNSGPRYI